MGNDKIIRGEFYQIVSSWLGKAFDRTFSHANKYLLRHNINLTTQNYLIRILTVRKLSLTFRKSVIFIGVRLRQILFIILMNSQGQGERKETWKVQTEWGRERERIRAEYWKNDKLQIILYTWTHDKLERIKKKKIRNELCFNRNSGKSNVSLSCWGGGDWGKGKEKKTMAMYNGDVAVYRCCRSTTSKNLILQNFNLFFFFII